MKKYTFEELQQLKLCTILDLADLDNVIRQTFGNEIKNNEIVQVTKLIQTMNLSDRISLLDDLILIKSLLQ